MDILFSCDILLIQRLTEAQTLQRTKQKHQGALEQLLISW